MARRFNIARNAGLIFFTQQYREIELSKRIRYIFYIKIELFIRKEK